MIRQLSQFVNEKGVAYFGDTCACICSAVTERKKFFQRLICDWIAQTKVSILLSIPSNGMKISPKLSYIRIHSFIGQP